jgi:PIN domain nuclease of toxin-antitoxin system
MNYLLDTHAFLWWIADDARLSAVARKIIASSKNKIHVSAASAFEIAIKANLGRLSEVGDPYITVPFHIRRNNFTNLPISVEDSLRVYSLAPLHTDPFDRLLIAQAKEHSLVLITTDEVVKRYPIETVW